MSRRSSSSNTCDDSQRDVAGVGVVGALGRLVGATEADQVGRDGPQARRRRAPGSCGGRGSSSSARRGGAAPPGAAGSPSSTWCTRSVPPVTVGDLDVVRLERVARAGRRSGRRVCAARPSVVPPVSRDVAGTYDYSCGAGNVRAALERGTGGAPCRAPTRARSAPPVRRRWATVRRTALVGASSDTMWSSRALGASARCSSLASALDVARPRRARGAVRSRAPSSRWRSNRTPVGQRGLHDGRPHLRRSPSGGARRSAAATATTRR